MRLFVGAVALAAALLAPISTPAEAPTSAKSPTPAPTSAPFQGFSARGTLVAAALVNGSTVKLGAEVAVASSRQRTRVDLIHLELSGNDASANAQFAQFLPHGTMTLVYDQRSQTTMIWSEQKHLYFQTKMSTAPKPKPTPAPKATVEPKSTTPPPSPLDQLLRASKAISEYEVLNQTLTLVGHQSINDHTSAVLHFTLQSQKHGGKLQEVSGDLALADDLFGIPVRLWVTAKGEHEGSVKLDLVSASAASPDAGVFVVPAGYKRVTDFTQLI